MIPLEKLRAVKRIITHEDCADGIASAMILKQALPDATVEFMQYSTPAHRALQPDEGLLFCDFSPWLPKATEVDLMPEALKRIEEFVAAGAIVLDHHGTQEKVVKAFGDLGVYADPKTHPGVSGAVLAFTEVWQPLCREDLEPAIFERYWPIVQMFAETAGVRDLWLKSDRQRFQEACEQREALRFWDVQDLLAVAPPSWADYMEIGRNLWGRHLRKVQAFLDRGVTFTSAKGTRVLISPGLSQTSDAAEMLDQQGRDVDLLVGFGYNASTISGSQEVRLIYSTRSHTGYRCDRLAQTFGGGGHQPAAGFTFTCDLDADANPYKIFRQKLAQFEAPYEVGPGLND